MIRKALFIAGIYASPLAAQAPDSTHPGTPAKEFYTRVVASPPDTVVDSIPFPVHDTVFVPAALKSGADTAISGDTTRITFWHEYVARFHDSVQVRVKAPSGTPVGGAGFGPSGYFNERTPGAFTYAPNVGGAKSEWVLDNIRDAKAARMPVQLAGMCGGHNSEKLGNCLRDSSGVAVFARARFDSTARAIYTPAVAAEILKAYREGWVTSIQIMDEPWVSGGDDGAGNIVGNTWGPKGTINRVRADSLCAFVKALVPGVPVGLSDHHDWDKARNFKVCDYGQPQFSYRFVQTRQFASIAAWRDFYLARAKAGGHQVSFSMNWINGGNQDRDGTWDCTGGIKGNRSPNCQMTPAQIVEVITVLGDHTCGGQMAWRSDATRFSSTAYQNAIKQMLAIQAGRTRKPCVVR